MTHQSDCTPQLDLFADSRDVMLRNDLIDALSARDAAAAQRCAERLRDEAPGDAALADAPLLMAALHHAADVPLASADAAVRARAQIEQQLTPAALRVFGAAAAPAWLGPLWAQLARRAAALPFSADAEQVHAAALWLQARDWAAAAQAAETVPSWRRIPAPLAWAAQARWHRAGPDAAWPLLAELAWLAPQRFDGVSRALPDAALARLLRRFDSDEHISDAGWAWLPAWALTEQPLLAAPLATAQPWRDSAPEQGFELVMALLRLEHNGRHADIVEHRKRLRALHGGLFAAYMRTR